MSRSIRSLACVAVGAAVLALGAGVVGAKSSGKKDSGTIYAAVTHTANGTEFIAGEGTDKLLGTIAVFFPTKIIMSGTGLPVTVKPATAFFKNGTLTGSATATLTITGTTATITNGKLTAKHGTAGEKGHSLVATFTGSGSLATGQYVFNYKGTYK